MKCKTVEIRGLKRKICYQPNHRGIAKNIPAGKEPSMRMVKKIHMSRPLKGRRRDEVQRSRHVLYPKNKGKASWVLNPNKWDIDGIDTPRRGGRKAGKTAHKRAGRKFARKTGRARCENVSINGKRRKICRDKKGHIVSNTKPRRK
jgi:hypothetical protein